MRNSKKFTTGRGERIAYGLYAFGAILSYYMIMSYLQLYMTDIGISALAVGMIFMFAKVWDAVNDPVFGVLVDKVNPKGGKYKFWLRIASIAIPLTTIFLFIIPAHVSIQVKIIWSAVAYVLWDTAYTMYDVPMNAIVTAMTEDLAERNKLYSISAFFVYLGGLIVAIFVPMIYPTLGWGMTAVLLGLLCMVNMLFLSFKCKERYVGTAEEESSIKDIFLSLVHNKYLLIFTLASIVGSITNFANTLNGYVAIYCLGSESYITLLSLASAVPVLFVTLLVPKLLEKMDKFAAYVITRVITIAIDVVICMMGYENVALLMILIVIKNIFAGVWGITGVMFIADCVEYGQYRTGERNQGIAFATKAFTNKIVVAVTGAIAMFGLAAYGFVEGAGASQTQETIKGIWTLYSAFPILGSVLSIIILTIFYKLRDKDVKLMIQVNNGEISRESAEEKFSSKF